MKRPISLHRTLAATALAAFFLAGSLQAQEPAGMEKEPSGTEESGISTPRRVAGLGVLAFLIGWMVWAERFPPPPGRRTGYGDRQ